MPIYDFKCQDCGKVSEILIRGTEGQAIRCTGCGSESMEKLISASYMIKTEAPISGSTCCGSAERCEAPPCSTDDVCHRR